MGVGIDLPPKQRSTIWSGKPGSNRRPQPWQGCALPTELFPRFLVSFIACTSQYGLTRVYLRAHRALSLKRERVFYALMALCQAKPHISPT